MKIRLTHHLLAALIGVVYTAEMSAQNTVVSYQGQVQSGGRDFSGTGLFKVALVTVTNAAFTATATATVSGQFVTIITVTFGGSGYVTPPAVGIIGGGGSGAMATASISGGEVTGITVTYPGSGYTSTPSIIIDPPPQDPKYTTYWSNDGTSADGGEPVGAVPVPVMEGLFTVRLGDTSLANMTPLPSEVFEQRDLHLRAWFDDGINGFAALEPTQPLTVAPYAAVAGSARKLLGTMDDQPLEFSVNGLRALRLEDNGDSGDFDTTPDGAPNIIGGSPGNFVGTGVVGATIAGGGGMSYGGIAYTNMVLSDHGTVGGGLANRVEAGSAAATIAGGRINGIGSNSFYSAIGGGLDNNIAAGAGYATIAGGVGNNIEAYSGSAVIGGGEINSIGENARDSVIGGGSWNNIGARSRSSAILGGEHNDIGTNSSYGAIGGGYDNNIEADAESAAITGGVYNDIGTNSDYSMIGGGYDNNIEADSESGTLAGGRYNGIGTNSAYSTIGGGYQNQIEANASYAVIPGGSGNNATNYAFAAGRRAHARHTGSFVWGDGSGTHTYSDATNSVTFRASGGCRIYTSAGGGGALLAAGSGSWTSLSDRNAKEDIRPVNPRDVLEIVASLPVSTWRYKTQDASVRHIGPMAQDFKAAFSVGESDTGITTVDADGVALAAIQGLNEKVEVGSQKAEVNIRQLEAKNAELERKLEELKRLVNLLSEQLRGSAE